MSKGEIESRVYRGPSVRIDARGAAPLPPREALPRRGLTRRWRWRAQHAGDAPSLLHSVLHARGLSEPGAAEAFLNPKLTRLHDPSLIPDLDRAAERLLAALRSGEPIAIYGDYDVDGITGTAILFHVLKALAPSADVRTYIPHRLDEGYGLNIGALEHLAKGGARVVVTVDCGVSAVAPALRAGEIGLDLIITDHHNPPARLDDLPRALAVVHPRRPDSRYPFGELSGAGVAFKLAWRLATLHAGGHKVGPALQTLLLDMLPLAALGAIADVVPLVDENRVIAWAGLGRMRSSPLIGLRALIARAGLESERVSSWDVGFKLAPRLNASGRMAHAAAAVELFTTADRARSLEIADELERCNLERREIERRIFEQAAALAEQSGMTRDDQRAIVLAHPEWHAGVVGIVCSRLVERFGRPTILMALHEGRAHGSCRSIHGYSIAAALADCARWLDKHGGHDMAAGLGLVEANLPAFTQALIAHANERLSVDDLTPSLAIDARAMLDELTPESVHELSKLEPHGAGNPAVRVWVPGVQIAAPVQPLGASGQHLALTVRHPGAMGVSRVVAWGWGSRREHLTAGQRLSMVVEPAVSTFTGRAVVEPVLQDLAFDD